MRCNVPSRPHYVFRVDFRWILLPVILAPAIARAESLELIRDASFANGFRLLSPEPGKRAPIGDLKPANATGTPVWELAQWNSRHPLTETDFANVETWLIASNAAKWVRVGTGANAGCLELGVDSRPEYDSRPRKTPAEPWTHLLVQQDLPGCPPLTDVAALRLKLEARLVENETFKPEGYSPDLHAAQFQAVLTIQNIRRDSPGHGDYLWFAVPLFDDRFDEPPCYVNRDFAVSQGKLIFNPGAAVFTSQRLRDGQWVRIDRDLRPLFIEALEEAWRLGYLIDSHNLADYRLTTINIGWEVPGLNRAAIKLREVSLRVERAVAGAGQATPTDGAEFHVATAGNDVDAGTKSHPFASLARARDAIRELKQQRGLPQGGVTIWVHPGEYPFAESFELTEADAGTADQPIAYRGIDRDGVHLVGGRSLPAVAFEKVSDAETRDRLDPAARDHVLGASLPSLGITEYGAFPDQFGGAVPMPELFFNDQRMTLARWPNEDWAEFTKVLESGPAPWRDHASDQLGVFAYEGGRPARWLRAPGVWLQGYWCFDWSCETIRVQDINTQEQRITLAKQHVYGLGSGNPGPRRFFAVNLLEELDQPGEYFLDRAAGRLFFWPPSPLPAARVVLSTLTAPVIALSNASHVTLRGLTIEACAGSGIEIAGGHDNSILACRVRNTGMDGIVVEGGTQHSVTACDIFDTGTSGLKMAGGDRKTLTPSGHQVVNNHIHHVSRRQRTAAYHVHLGGVGVRLAHNLLHDSPHQAIGLAGNDHLIEYNEIHHTGMETDDCGSFYMGRNPSERGSTLRYNFWHHIGSTRSHGSCAVYFDDGAGGQTVFGNIFYRAAGGNFGAVFSHGGHDNTVRNCIFIECPLALGSAPWNDDAWKEWLTGPLWQQSLLKDVDITREPYVNRYPDLRGFMQSTGKPRRNHAIANLIVNCRAIQTGNWEVTGGLVTDADPGFVDSAKLDFRLREDSTVFQQIPGFEPIPVDRIGPERDEPRGEVQDSANE